MIDLVNRENLQRWLKYAAGLMGFSVLYVMLDFSVDLRPPGIHNSYQFTLHSLAFDEPVLLRQDNLVIVVIRRSADTISKLHAITNKLQDPGSLASRQPEFARNPVRSHDPEYFVAIALGTHLGCPIEVDGSWLTETCSDARYDFAGRALQGANEFRNLTVPEYVFADQLKTLTIRP